MKDIIQDLNVVAESLQKDEQRLDLFLDNESDFSNKYFYSAYRERQMVKMYSKAINLIINKYKTTDK